MIHLNDLLEPYNQYGNLHYGEGVTELAHALQTAYLAQKAGENESMIAAALLHDYGHLVPVRGRLCQVPGSA